MSIRIPILVLFLVFSLAACGDSADPAPVDTTEAVGGGSGGGGKDDSFETSEKIFCNWDYRFIAENSRDLGEFIVETNRYNLTNQDEVTDIIEEQVVQAVKHLGFVRAGEDLTFEEALQHSQDRDFAIHLLEDYRVYEWVQFYAGDTEIGVVFEAGSSTIVAEVGDGEVHGCHIEESLICEAHYADLKLDATLWVQTSPEFQAAASQAYRFATLQLDQAIEDQSWVAALEQGEDASSKPPAIILDLDETVLDNSPYQARLIAENKTHHHSRFRSWVNEADADFIPGADEFLHAAAEKGVTIFYVSNRTDSLEEGTRENLEKLGLPLDEDIDTVLLKNEEDDWGSNKTTRREAIAENYRIIMLFGDNLDDFVSTDKGSVDQRMQVGQEHLDNFGTKWFMLPNPMYGYWESATYGHWYGTTAEEKRDVKLLTLDPRR